MCLYLSLLHLPLHPQLVRQCEWTVKLAAGLVAHLGQAVPPAGQLSGVSDVAPDNSSWALCCPLLDTTQPQPSCSNLIVCTNSNVITPVCIFFLYVPFLCGPSFSLGFCVCAVSVSLSQLCWYFAVFSFRSTVVSVSFTKACLLFCIYFALHLCLLLAQ